MTMTISIGRRPRSRFRVLFIGAATIALIVFAAVRGSSAQSIDGAQDIAAGWAALAAGRGTDGEKHADTILRTAPRNHDAAALKIAARVASGNLNGSLDAYEQWLTAVGQREDAFLLERIALGVVHAAATSKDRNVRARALEILSAMGNAEASVQLSTLTDQPTTSRMDAALARKGDAVAIARLTARIKDPAARDVSDAIDALREANAKGAAAAIATALDPSRPMPTKIAAARALGQLGSSAEIPRLRTALKDPDPPVRVVAAVSLTTLGDQAGAEIVQSLENSPIGDYRLLAVEARAASEPTGSWVGVATRVLDDPDPLVRLRAAELLVRHAADPGKAPEVLRGALGDSNPAMRQAAVDRLSEIPITFLERDLPTLRKLLRDSFAPARLEAAAALLRISGALAQ